MIPSRLLNRLAWCAAAMAVGVLGAPAAAAVAEGPGYGGTADALTVQWPTDAGDGQGLAVYAVGFRGGSSVTLRVGAAADEKVNADEAGALRVLLVSVADRAATRPAAGMTVLPVDVSIGGRLSPGMSVQAIGQDPAGSIRTLVGSVPPPAAGNGVQDVPLRAALVVAVLAGSGLLLVRARRSRATRSQGSKR